MATLYVPFYVLHDDVSLKLLKNKMWSIRESKKVFVRASIYGYFLHFLLGAEVLFQKLDFDKNLLYKTWKVLKKSAFDFYTSTIGSKTHQSWFFVLTFFKIHLKKNFEQTCSRYILSKSI